MEDAQATLQTLADRAAYSSDPIVLVLILLAAGLIAVPIFQRFKLGAVLGYLAAGLAIGPALGLVSDIDAVATVAEFGVVLFLFIIGLELKPTTLWSLRKSIFGSGSGQMLGSTLLLSGAAMMFGFSWQSALIIGWALALSSTAIALAILDERHERETPHGKATFGILLFQDLTVVPLLALASILAPRGDGGMGLTEAGIALGAVVALVVIGRFMLNPLFHILAKTGVREVMTAGALMIVLGAAFVMEQANLSTALGALIAGVMLSESDFRHQLEADIEPFRGLLMGLFFLAVGLSIDLGVLTDQFLVILAITLLGLIIKLGVTYAVMRMMGEDHAAGVKTTAYVCQFGEFGFVVFGVALAGGLVDGPTQSILACAVALSMALTPVLINAAYALTKNKTSETMEEDYSSAQARVLIIGFGRFGQFVSQTVQAGGERVTVIDTDADRIRDAKRFKARIYYGDGTRLDILAAAGLARADILAVCTDGRATTTRIVEAVREAYPDLPIYARAYDRGHALELLKIGATEAVRETFHSSIEMGRQVLLELGIPEDEADFRVADVRARDEKRFAMQAEDGILAGVDLVFPTGQEVPKPKPMFDPVPEPLIQTDGEAEALSPETEAITKDDT
ncbi:monovalent cation:proton antiporter-2 (CPA2) family protein [Ahrensia marina]|uniref:monovalent cation:proton antiporter-2 (CPA2) family protein n=1 Tax=Ahrensia marina TaxID=1514904 RepID=UPI0035D0BB81